MGDRASNVDEKAAAPEGRSARYRPEGRELGQVVEARASGVCSRISARVVRVVDVGRNGWVMGRFTGESEANGKEEKERSSGRPVGYRRWTRMALRREAFESEGRGAPGETGVSSGRTEGLEAVTGVLSLNPLGAANTEQ